MISVLPLHVWERELDSRILQGLALADRGETVIIGHEYNLAHIYDQIDGLFYYGAGRPVEDPTRTHKWYKPIVSRGGYVGLTYEEGINDLLGSHKMLTNITPTSIECCDQYFLWSQLDYNLCLEECPVTLRKSFKAKMCISSNTRIELLGPIGREYFAKQVASITELFNDYFLISDNFACEAYGENQMREGASSKALIRDRFANLMNQIIADNPEKLFILRPHPVGGHDYWYRALNTQRNLIILSSGPIWPWIFSCAGVIHSGCTVGMEAELAGVPAFDVRELCQDTRSQSIANYVSRKKCETLLDLQSAISHAWGHMGGSRQKYQWKARAESSTEHLLQENIKQLDLSGFTDFPDLSRSFPEKSAINIVLRARDDFRACQSTSVDLSAGEISRIWASLGKSRPLPQKSRHYSKRELERKVRSGYEVLGLTKHLEMTHLESSNCLAIHGSFSI